MKKSIAFLSSFFILGSLSAKVEKVSNAEFLSPQQAIEKMDIPQGFEVKTFVSEPDIGETIAMCFDSRGRLWALDNLNYVNRRHHFTGDNKNRIQIFEDTNGDGVFDIKKTFMENLPFSSGIAVGFGGVYLGTPPNLLFIPDADGDDKPDAEPEILLDGWGIKDRHETLNSFIWGPDGWLYGCHGVFTESWVGKPGDKKDNRQFIDGGIWRFHPIRKEFEVFARGLSNPWGFDFNDVGDGFSTGCVIPHLFHIVQGGVYDKQSKPNYNSFVYDNIKTIRDHVHKSAHGGARFYLGGAFPEKYNDQLFMCNIHEHALLTDYMEPKGSSYIGKHGEDFMPTNDKAWIGFSLELGADGAMYILDWHDQDICGNSVKFPNSARVYRLAPKGLKNPRLSDLRKRSDIELAELQLHKNDWFVKHARIILQERAAHGTLETKSVEPILWRIFRNSKTSGKRLRGLWALHAIETLKEKSYEKLIPILDDKDERVRSWAIQLLCEEQVPEKLIAKFAEMAKHDSSAVVRRYLSCALQRLPFDQRWSILAALADHEEDVDDHLISKLLWLALEPMVIPHTDKAMELAFNSKMPRLQEYVPRRALVPYVQSKGVDAANPILSAVKKMMPGFRVVANVGKDFKLEYKQGFRGKNVIRTYPRFDNKMATFTKAMNVPKGKKTYLSLSCSLDPHTEWELEVKVGKETLLNTKVNADTVKDGWFNLDVDLTKYAGRKVYLQVLHKTSGKPSFAYWNHQKIKSLD